MAGMVLAQTAFRRRCAAQLHTPEKKYLRRLICREAFTERLAVETRTAGAVAPTSSGESEGGMTAQAPSMRKESCTCVDHLYLRPSGTRSEAREEQKHTRTEG